MNEPEWAYHRLAASTSFEGGLSVHNPGYLPGISALLRPFFLLPEGVGLALFIVIALLSAWCLLHLSWRECARRRPDLPARMGPWRWLWLSAPVYLAIQNNQLMVQMMALVVAGFLLVQSGRRLRGLAALALAVTIKTFPIGLALLFLSKRRWREAFAFGLLAAGVTLLLGAAVYGLDGSLGLHLGWPARAAGQDPTQLLRGDEPRYFQNNQSVAAWLVRSAPWAGSRAALAACLAVFWGSLLLTAWVVLRRGAARGRPDWDEFALWLAWIVLAAPFGRYYYAVMLLPAWICLAYPAASRAPGWPTWFQRLAFALPVLAWFSRGAGMYPLLCGATFTMILRQVWVYGPVHARAAAREREWLRSREQAHEAAGLGAAEGLS